MTCAEVRDAAAAFVLDALEEDEMAAVRAHLAGCPEAHAELRELGVVVSALNETITPVEPPATLRERILAAAAAEPNQRLVPARATLRPSPPTYRTPVYRQPVFAWASAFVALALVVVLGGAAYLQQGRLDAAQRYADGVAAVLELAADEGGRLAILGAEGAPAQGLAGVGADGRVAIALRNLAPTTGNEVYEAWIIAGDAAPLPIGSFTVTGSGTGTIVTSAQAFDAEVVVAVTLEAGPGASAPGGPIVAAGKAA